MEQHHPPPEARPISWAMIFPALILGAAIGYIASEPGPWDFWGVYSLFNSVRPDCRIKGNISISSRERIYHVPGQHWYEETVISPQYGERWFCTEEEAQAAGWRRAGY